VSWIINRVVNRRRQIIGTERARILFWEGQRVEEIVVEQAPLTSIIGDDRLGRLMPQSAEDIVCGKSKARRMQWRMTCASYVCDTSGRGCCLI
jgi:hypothetical protein